VEFWGFPDSEVCNTAELRAAVAETISRIAPHVVLATYGGPEWAPGYPNQRDHMEFAAAVREAYDGLGDLQPRWLFENGLEHREYLSVLDPNTPVGKQAHDQVAMTTPSRADFGGHRAVGFEVVRTRDAR